MRKRNPAMPVAVILFGIILALSAALALPARRAAAYTYPPGWRLEWVHDMGSMFKHSSPTLADIDGDGRREVLIGNSNGHFYCVDAGGGIRWDFYTGAPIQSTPMAVDCDGDGRLEIFFGCDSGYVYGLNADGQPLSAWGWPKFAGSAFGRQEVFSSPSCGDLDGDGDLEIVVGSWGHYITAWHYQGPTAWQYYNADTVWSSPACADIDLDGRDEVVIGADCWGGNNWPWPRGGLLYVFEGDGSIKSGWPKCLPQVIWSSPAIADLDRDGFPDIVVGTGLFWQNTNPGAGNYLSYADGKHVYAFNYRGESLPGWPVNTGDNNFGSPAVADIDGDGFYEVALGSLDSNIYVWEHDGRVKWTRCFWPVQKMGSPAIADIDGDGDMDVIISEGLSIMAYDPNGEHVLDADMGGNMFNSVAVGDIDADGRTELVIATGAEGQTGKLFCWETGPYRSDLAAWPMFRKDARHSASYSHEEVPDIWPPEKVKSRCYMAEGYTGRGFSQWILLMNPLDREIMVQIRYILPSGLSVIKVITIPPRSRMTVPVNTTIDGQEVSASVISDQEGLIAERALYFDYDGGSGTWSGGHNVMAVDTPRTEWYFAEGCTRPGFHTWLTLQNPGEEEAHVTLDYLCGDGANVRRTLTVRARARYTVAVHGDAEGIGAHDNDHGDVSIKVTSDVPVVAERPMYFNYNGSWDGGSNVMGASAPSPEWFFAEGCTRPGFHTWLCLQNPGDVVARVTLDYLCGDGKNVRRELKVKARSRATVAVHGDSLGIGAHDGPHGDVSIKVTSDVPVVAERPMYFNYNGAWPGGHNVVGSPRPHTKWVFAEGCTRPGFHTWLCLQNPGDVVARVTLDYLCGDGKNVRRELTVKARSRATVAVHGDDLGIGVHDGPHGDVSIRVTSDLPIMAERPVYFLFNGRIAGGHNTEGYPLD
ncbi:MAG: VCBS repeat-containing protein [Actinobacteria bacterium]|nr:VCBS repeat-containing protein [Actinomycetota bacterium]